MKKICVLLLFAIITITTSFACEIKFNTEGVSKPVYNSNDVLVVKMTLVLTHRNCPEGLEATKYDYTGFKVLGATEWTEVKEGIYERKFKLQVKTDTKGKASFSALRSCHKEGGSGTFEIKVE